MNVNLKYFGQKHRTDSPVLLLFVADALVPVSSERKLSWVHKLPFPEKMSVFCLLSRAHVLAIPIGSLRCSVFSSKIEKSIIVEAVLFKYNPTIPTLIRIYSMRTDSLDFLVNVCKQTTYSAHRCRGTRQLRRKQICAGLCVSPIL